MLVLVYFVLFRIINKYMDAPKGRMMTDGRCVLLCCFYIVLMCLFVIRLDIGRGWSLGAKELV